MRQVSMTKMRILKRSLAILLLLALTAGAVFYFRPVWVFRHIQALQLAAEGVKSREVTIDGHMVHYFVRGPVDGTPIVLVHGLGARAEDWVNLAPYLVKAGYRVYTPDLLGFGQSDKP